MDKDSLQSEHLLYQKQLRRRKYLILFWQIALVVAFFALWELFARIGWIDAFLFSSPSAAFSLLSGYLQKGEIFSHIGISVWETTVGFVLASVFGIFIAILLWCSPMSAKILEPILIVLNALPKTALAPILIVWIGAGIDGIIAVAISISIIVTIISSYHHFCNVEEEKIRLFQSFGATKLQILTKLILPANIVNLMSVIKINLGLSWVGVIVGEFLVSRRGIGYLIVYGSQVFRLDLVMMGVIVLAFCAWIMYECINLLDKQLAKSKKRGISANIKEENG